MRKYIFSAIATAITILSAATVIGQIMTDNYQILGEYILPESDNLQPPLNISNDPQQPEARQNQGEFLRRIIETREAEDNSGDWLHKVSNVFSYEVGNALKAHYPAKIDNLAYDVQVVNGKIRLAYYVDIVKADKDTYLSYFDHRGSFRSGSDPYETLKDATNRSEKQYLDSFPAFAKASENGHLETIRGEPKLVSYKNGYVALSEYFFAWRQ